MRARSRSRRRSRAELPLLVHCGAFPTATKTVAQSTEQTRFEVVVTAMSDPTPIRGLTLERSRLRPQPLGFA